MQRIFFTINPLNAELNPICHLLALLGAHHILYVSRVRVKSISIVNAAVSVSKTVASNGWAIMESGLIINDAEESDRGFFQGNIMTFV
jgi:hypothetical protein